MLPRELHHRIQIVTHPTEALEVTIDECSCLGVRDLELPGERVRPLSVNRREVDRLGARSHLRGDGVDRDVKDERGGLSMNVTAGLEGLHECRVIREMR